MPAKANFVTCAITTEALEAIAERTERLAEDLETIKLQNELERLDREWTMELERYKVHGKDGHYSVPSAGGSIAGGAFAIAFGIFWMVQSASLGAPGIFPLFGLIFIGVGVAGFVSGSSKASAYEQARRTYERRRQDVLRGIRARTTAARGGG